MAHPEGPGLPKVASPDAYPFEREWGLRTAHV
jgi:hypothetical protein